MNPTAHERATVAALAGFTDMTTARLRSLRSGRDVDEAFALAAGWIEPTAALSNEFRRSPQLQERWRRSARSTPPQSMAQRCADLGIAIVLPEDTHFPAQLHGDPRRPEILFVRGDLEALDSRRVGIVGTRNPTRRGAQTAARFGHELADAGVCVVSGLALGVDGAAHRGALAVEGARPVAVVANGLDQAYPRRHASLWADVAERGALITEWPPGVLPDPYRFPQRNRILAALSELVVVIESRERGGSLITAREAAERGIDVFAVPGSIDQRACAGTNALLEVGAAPAASTDTLLAALGLDHRRAHRSAFDSRPRPQGMEADVLRLCGVGPQSVEQLAAALAIDLASAAMALARLERSGWLAEAGGWFEPVDEYARFV